MLFLSFGSNGCNQLCGEQAETLRLSLSGTVCNVTIPIVFARVGDPVGAGLVASLNRPGGNVTGVTSQASDLVGKRLQIVRDLLPAKRTLGVLLNPDTPFSALALQEAPFWCTT